MATRPWMMFYPSDWLGSSRLRHCSLAARGLAIELICHMHQGEPYGYLTVKSYVALARLVGMSRRDVPKLVTELVENGVVLRPESISKTVQLFSPRMVRDHEKMLKRQADGGKGGNPALRKVVNREDKPTDTRDQSLERKNDSCAVADATHTSEIDKKIEGEFEEFWKVKPKRKGANPRIPAFKAYKAAIKSGADPALILAATRQWATEDRDKIGTEFVPMAVTWLRQMRFERDDLPKPPKLFPAHPASPEFKAWKAFFEKGRYGANVRELEKRELEGRAYEFGSQWPPGHKPPAPLKLVVGGAA